MKKISFPVILIYILIFLYLILYPSISSVAGEYIRLIPVIGLGIIAIGCIIIRQRDGTRIHVKRSSLQNILICALIYQIIYYLSGLIFTFQYSAYSHAFVTMSKNIFYGVVPIILQEYIRGTLVEYTKKNKFLLLLIVALFTCLTINLNVVSSSFNTGESAFKYISSVLLPAVSFSMLYTYIAYNYHFSCNILFRSIIDVVGYLTPIFPNLNWFLTALYGVVTPSIIYLYFNYIKTNTSERLSRKIIKKDNPLKAIPIYAILLALAGFVYGLFPYVPVAVMSNSMYPQFTRGDVVVVKKLDNGDKQKIKVGDTIEFEKDGRFILHRVIEIENANGVLKYYTKGDNNDEMDSGFVLQNDIKGIIKFVVPVIGYPSVIFSEVLSS